MSNEGNKMLWGVSTWRLFHTMAARIREESYPYLKGQLLAVVKQICYNLPCPEWARHATQFMRNVHLSSFPNRTVFISMLFQFHNSVNARLGKRQYTLEDLKEYKNRNIGIDLQNFLTFYAKRYNGTLQAGIQSTELIRRRIAISVRAWLQKNWLHFN